MFKGVRYLSLLPLLLQVALAAVSITPAPNALSGPNRHLVENELPQAQETHEVAVLPDTNIMCISQMKNSVLLKAQFDINGTVQHVSAFQIGQPSSALHGVTNSKLYPGKLWVTLQQDNKLLLLDPVASSLESAPVIVKELDIPSAGQPDVPQGPHYISEYDGNLWVAIQDSAHVYRVNPEDPANDWALFKVNPRPVFVAQNPANSNFYSGLDNDNSVTHGTGTVGFISGSDEFTYHRLQNPVGSSASLLHLAFDTDYETNHVLWLLSSSIIKSDALDMLIKVTFNAEWSAIVSEEYVTLPTQISKAHRVFVTPEIVFVTELASSRVVGYLKPEVEL
ncbi:hypothetical protein BGW38_006929 [Lunasporangiospora selenospora]|uniref:Uncharacterized protein n=1 Tax=Lunasporangiospora selenospora TaxID=979761 RepID=A0A9P6FZI1_9FUNG|nr:hypothetical protein BGW38_006929 [Lunasporangiospora selenospora]